jgi:3-hydroxyisobutyrate dehydrogenase-like beta-hydroxyacid dehydrogenase
MIADEKISSDGFKMSLALKDMRLALAAADSMTAPMPVASHEFVRRAAVKELVMSGLSTITEQAI